ncbi:glycosyltransferase [Roseitranquillus sediminis]|uniref:glycosyltransferase n=1 Tax=Roseitranquillus sediminis TaxID=2809051 RepID=UPI001D0C7805|nr:glycosyltransferase [Roseitranquillus sediminis]MBM9594010.1 glycosyltransferase [Roseitranquillus sediminis]
MEHVSILIPAYNAEEWITEAIESALRQGPDVEVVVVDDGSTDGTVERIAAFEGRIRWETGPNRGAPAARNRLLELAEAPWVQYLDADDYLMPGKVAAQLEALRRMEDVDVLYGPETVEWREAGSDVVRRTISDIPEPRDPWVLLALWKLPQTGAPLWRRQALLDVGGWREDQPCCQEHELYLRLLLAGKRFAYHPAGGAVYRRFSDGTLSTRNPSLVRRERLKIEKRIEEHLASTGALTPERQWAIDQARFDMARSAWPQDRAEARALRAVISTRDFCPRGPAAPPAYWHVASVLGFEAAEWLAAVMRRVRSLRSGGF